MAWNEPGGGNRDPWKGKGDGPDMDAMLRRIRDSITRLFGGMGGGSRPGGLWAAALAIVMVWVVYDSCTVIDAREVGVVLRFGQFNRVMSDGFNLKWPGPIEHLIRVDASSVRSVSDEVRILTKDENIVVIDFNVQYKVNDANKFLFSAQQPDETLKQAAESAVRQIIGRSDMDTVLSSHGTEVVSETKARLQLTLDEYKTGLLVNDINFQKILPPPEVKEAFDDANNAGNNQQQFINEAKAYAAQVVPLARGEAARIRAESEGYKVSHIAMATGDAQRFSLIDAQYRAAPEVTRKRLYLETMQSVLSNANKVVDQSNGKNLLYLPLDKLKTDGASVPAAAAAAVAADEHNTNRGGGQ